MGSLLSALHFQVGSSSNTLPPLHIPALSFLDGERMPDPIGQV